MRARRASLLGAAALLAGPVAGAAITIWNAHRLGMHPIERFELFCIRQLDAAWQKRYQDI